MSVENGLDELWVAGEMLIELGNSWFSPKCI